MPDWRSLVRKRLTPLRMEAAAESDFCEELADHLEHRYRELIGGGASEEDAHRSTIAELEDMYPVQSTLDRRQRMPRRDAVPAGDSKPGSFLEDLWRDLRYSVRGMRKNPLFVAFVVMTLAVGIGANTTVFTVLNILLLNPVPVPDSSRVAAIAMAEAESNGSLAISYTDLQEYRRRNTVFTALAGYTSPRVLTWQTGPTSQRLFGELVTGDYFSTLGLRPAVGRFFLPEEDGAPGASPVAVMNYGTWQTRFGASADIVGKTLRLNGLVFTVVGVAPPSFIGINAIFGPDLWIPAAMTEQLLPREMQSALSDRNKMVFLGVGRLKPGINRKQAQAETATLAANLAREYPATNQGHAATVRPIRDVVFGSAAGGSATFVFAGVVLSIVVAIVLLIACSNVANLLLARSEARQQEMAVRLAMGASRPRLMRQLLTESALLGLLSGALGVFLGYSGLRLLLSALPGSANFVSPKLDGTVLGFALVISLATGFIFGAIPALRLSRATVPETLKHARTMGTGRSGVTLANALLVGQVAFSFLLLVTAGLFLRSIQRAYEIDPGFQTAHLAVLLVNPGQAGYGRAQTLAFFKDAGQRVARLPDVESVSWASNLPLWARPVSGLSVEGHEPRSAAAAIPTIVNTVDLNYFETAGVAIERGREFTNADRETSTPVAIVNEKLAHDFWPDKAALGKRVRLPGEKQMRQIVGIAGTANYSTWAEPPQRCVYVPLEQSEADGMTLYVRSKGDPRQVLNLVQREVAAAGPQIVVTDIRTGRGIIDGGLFQARLGVMLLSVFGLLALGLASIGLYGIMAYSVSRRRREIGVRMALGAALSGVLRLVLKDGMSLVLAGLLIGFAAALLVGRLLTRMLYGVSASDPVSVAGAALVLLAVALLACYLPARWATRIDPLIALREA